MLMRLYKTSCFLEFCKNIINGALTVLDSIDKISGGWGGGGGGGGEQEGNQQLRCMHDINRRPTEVEGSV